MKKLIFYIPAIIFTVLYGALLIGDVGAVSPVVAVWLALFFASGVLLSKDIFWAAALGALPAIHLIFMGTRQTGQIVSETPIGIAVLIFYIFCGIFVFYKLQKAQITEKL
ncbi:MAG: hypothetical protein RR998_05295 [Oscillospiraceae bacterium]